MKFQLQTVQSLVPFSANSKFSLDVVLELVQNRHAIQIQTDFHLKGPLGDLFEREWLESVALSGSAQQIHRQERLWLETCFEIFVQPDASVARYFEIHCTPALSWNAYCLESIRGSLSPLPEVTFINHFAHTSASTNELITHFAVILPVVSPEFRISSTAVLHPLQNTKKAVEYFARQHNGLDQPDFHVPATWETFEIASLN